MESNGSINSESVIRFKLFDYLLAAYFFICPLEFAFNAVVPGGSTVKYLGATIIILQLSYLYKYSLKMRVKAFHISMYLWIFIVFSSYFRTYSINYALIYMTSYINIVIFFILLTIVNYNYMQVRLFINSTLWGSTVSAIIMLSGLNLYHGVGQRYTFNFLGAELDPNNAAAFLCYGVAISLYNIFSSNNKNQVFGLIIFMINLIALFFTGSRGGFITISIVTVFILFDNFRATHIWHKNTIKKILGVTIIFFVTALVLNYFVPEELLNRIFQIESYEGGSDRIIIWSYAFDKLLEKPLFGYGIGSFPEIARAFFGTDHGVHNTYLMVLFEVGLIGFTFFLAFIANLAKIAVNKKNMLAVLLILVAIIPAIFLDALVKRFFWNGLILCYMLIYNLDLSERNTS